MWVRDKLLLRWAIPDLYLGGACELPELLPDFCPALLIQLPRREKQIFIMPRCSNPTHPQITQCYSGAGHNLCPSERKPRGSEPFLSNAPNFFRACSATPVPMHESHSPSANLGFPAVTPGFVPSSHQHSYIRGLCAERVLNLTLPD